MGMTKYQSAMTANLIRFAEKLIHIVTEDEEQRKEYEKELKSIVEGLELKEEK